MTVPGSRVEEIFVNGITSRLKLKDKHPYICPGCSEEITANTEKCPNCGLEFRGDYGDVSKKDKKHKIATALGTAIFPGIGQLHNDHLEKSLIFLFLGVLSHYYILNYLRGVFIFTPILIIMLLWAYFIYDAYSSVPNFAYQEGVSPANKDKSYIKAVLGSLVFPGIGQIYNGQYTKGVIMILITFLGFFYLFWAEFLGSILLEPLHIIFFLVWFWAFNIYDSLIISRKINQLKTAVFSPEQNENI